MWHNVYMHISDDSNSQFSMIDALYGMSYEYQKHLDQLMKEGHDIDDPAVQELMRMITEYSRRASDLSIGVFD